MMYRRRIKCKNRYTKKGTALESPVAQTIARQDLNCSSAADRENGEMPNFSALSKSNRDSSSLLKAQHTSRNKSYLKLNKETEFSKN
jgi:hypothetical protein